ncbi:hypothetical protein LOD99_14106 [Oopsacas minuta]|uniref:STI1/HOP DP domain-containing protein n=1 Tax=Oopsacas minuta TaxID=111878 RepID=A0AAV7KGU4_9METZ|nr:hypothetical protein LOD99_14106 [Oopsacas minuta]
MAEPDDLPPLEDFSPLFEKLSASNQTNSTQQTDAISTIPNVPLENIKEEKPKTDSFGGLRKGFLNPKPKKEISQEVTMLKSNPSKGGASVKMDEMKRAVDDSMKEQISLLPENWMTDSLLDKVESNPMLAQAFRHPEFSNVITRFTQNPTQAIHDYGDTPAFREFFKEMCALLSQHFTQLADETEGDVEEVQIEDEEDKKMREILCKEDVQEAMQDPRIRQLVMDMKQNPERAQNTFITASPQLKRKIYVLTNNNIIGLQSK